MKLCTQSNLINRKQNMGQIAEELLQLNQIQNRLTNPPTD